jgi:Flp pilus assembly protein TadG
MSIRSHFKKLATDNSGQFSIMLSVALPMLMAAVGMATDLSEQQRVKFDLQNAVDASVLSAADLAQSGATEDQIKARIKTFFLAQCPIANCETNVVLTPTILQDRVRVEAQAKVKTYFMGMVGKSTLNADAKAEMTLKSIPVYYEVHMALDNSGSMNIIDGLQNMRDFRVQFNPWGATCAFACHDRVDAAPVKKPQKCTTKKGKTTCVDDGYYPAVQMTESGADMARRLGFPLREDRLRTQMITQAQSLLNSTANNSRIKVATYDFDWWVRQRLAPSTNFQQVKLSIEGIPRQSGGTQYAYFANEMARLVGSSGSGATELTPKKAIVMITDGVSQVVGSDALETIPTATCNKLKENGRELFILNMVYPDPNELTTGYNSAVEKVKALRPNLATSLQACASPGRYYAAEYGSSIDTALESIKQAVLKDAKSMYLAY